MITLTNLNAMRSAAAMAESNADIKTSMERLSTGSGINSASDDANFVGSLRTLTVLLIKNEVTLLAREKIDGTVGSIRI